MILNINDDLDTDTAGSEYKTKHREAILKLNEAFPWRQSGGLVENLVPARPRTPRRSSPTWPWWQQAQERKLRRRFLLKTRLSLPTPSLSLMVMPRQQEMTTPPDSESSSEFTSPRVESWPVVTLSHICLRNLVLLSSRKLRDLIISSTNFFSHTETEFARVVCVPSAL